MNEQSEYVKSIIRTYFQRLPILVSQIPLEFRRLMLPPYMLYTGFKSSLHIDPSGRLGFEILRERASRSCIKVRETKKRVEFEILGNISKAVNAFLVS